MNGNDDSFVPALLALSVGAGAGFSLARSLIDAQKNVAGGGLRFIPLFLLIMPVLLMSAPQNADAANAIPTTVQVSYTRPKTPLGGGNDYYRITAGYSDGTTRIARMAPHIFGSSAATACFLNGIEVNNCRDSYAESDQLPGIVFAWSTTETQIIGVGYEPFTDCSQDYCVTAALKEKPATNVTQVYNVPGTGLPDGLTTIGVTSAIVASIGMVLVAVRRRMVA